MGMGGALAGPDTAYLYDWNMLPIGQALWLKELETYEKFPPMQDPASYNLDQVLKQVKKPTRVTRATSLLGKSGDAGWPERAAHCVPDRLPPMPGSDV